MIWLLIVPLGYSLLNKYNCECFFNGSVNIRGVLGCTDGAIPAKIWARGKNGKAYFHKKIEHPFLKH